MCIRVCKANKITAHNRLLKWTGMGSLFSFLQFKKKMKINFSICVQQTGHDVHEMTMKSNIRLKCDNT